MEMLKSILCRCVLLYVSFREDLLVESPIEVGLELLQIELDLLEPEIELTLLELE